MKTYVYKLAHKYVKNRELLLNYGFSLYKESEDAKESFYVINLLLDKDSIPVKRILKKFNKLYEKSDEARRAEIEGEGHKFVKGVYKPTKKQLDELRKAQLCICNVGETRNLLFVNDAMNVEYYDTTFVDTCAKIIVDKLTEAGVIYTKRTPAELK